MSPVLTVKHCASSYPNGHRRRTSNGIPDAQQSYEVALRDQFQGALMGLALVPAALQIDAITYRQTPAVRLINTSAPGLLRHHNHWQRRRQWIEYAVPAQISALQASNSRISISAAQLLLTGDWLEAIITKRDSLSSFIAERKDTIETDLHRYNLSDEQTQCYRALHQCLHRIFIQDAVISESYALSIQTVENEVCASNTFAEHESALVRTAIIGFLIGAAGGLAALPALWQMNLARANLAQTYPAHTYSAQNNPAQTYSDSVSASRQAILFTGNQLYEQWAGVLAYSQIATSKNH